MLLRWEEEDEEEDDEGMVMRMRKTDLIASP